MVCFHKEESFILVLFLWPQKYLTLTLKQGKLRCNLKIY